MPFAVGEPAGGAALREIAIVTGFLGGGFAILLAQAMRHRRGLPTLLGWTAAVAARVSRLPEWAALPLAVVSVSYASVYAGFMWDSSLHIDDGRDPGPLANPGHYFMLLGLFGVIAAGFMAMALPRGRKPVVPSAIRVSDGWYAPAGGVMIFGSGAVAMSGFPLDDVWHRLFGQDVTLWGPTHLIMLGGEILTLVGVAVLLAEATRGRRVPFLTWAGRALVSGAILVGLSAFLAEFDFGVQQFRLVLQPALIAFAAAAGLVLARHWAGPGGALAAGAFYFGARAFVALLVGPVLGETTPAQPLFLVEAVLVELAFLVRARPLIAGAVAGALAGTLGFASEWVWVDAVMPISWTAPILTEAAIGAAAAGTAGGLLGALLAMALRRVLAPPRVARAVWAGALVAVAGVLANGLLEANASGVRAHVDLRAGTVRFDPPSAAADPTWVQVIAWQGDTERVGFALERIGPGVYRIPRPIPVGGEWKSGIRLHQGRSLISAPVYAPADPAIGEPEVAAPPRFTRAMIPDRVTLQRERKEGVPSWLWDGASLIVLLIGLGLMTGLAAGVARFARAPLPAPPTRKEMAWTS